MELKILFNNYIKRYKNIPIPIKASFWFVICSVIQKGVLFFTIPLFTRLITTEQYGQVTLYQTWSSILCIITTLNLEYGTFNTAQIRFSKDIKRYISSILTIVSLLSLIFGLIFFIKSSVIETITELPILVIELMVIDVWAQFAISLWMARKKFNYQYKEVICITIISAISIPILGLLIVPHTIERGISRIATMAVVNIIIGTIFHIKGVVYGRTLFVGEYWKYALSFNVPLIPYYLSQAIFNMSDRIMISKMVGTDKAGIYGLVYSISTILVFVINAIGDAFSPWYFRKIRDKDMSQIKDINRILMTFVSCIMLFIILIGPEFVYIMGGASYAEAIWIIPPVVCSLVILYLSKTQGYIQFYFEKKWVLVGVTAISAILNIILNYYCIRNISYIVAGYTTLASYIVLWILSSFYSEKICKDNNLNSNECLDIKGQIVILIAFIICMIISTLIYTHIVLRYLLLLLDLLILFIFRNKIFQHLKVIGKLRENKDEI